MKTGLIFAAAVVAASSAASADPRDDALAAMTRCSTLQDPGKRLGCFDATMARAPGAAVQIHPVSALPGATGPEVNASIPAPPPRKRTSGFMSAIFGDGASREPQTTVAEFGSESIANGGNHANPIPMRGDTIDQISARLVAASFASGYITVTLDNGQAWHQTASAGAVGNLNRPPGSYTAVIARSGFDGSYAMHLSGVARTIAVRRIR